MEGIKIKKLFFIILLIVVNVIPVVANANDVKPSAGMPVKIGGWYPVFFETYSTKKVNQIIESITKGNVSKIIISYDENNTLAIKIQNKIINQTKFPVELSHIHQKDDKLVRYNHTEVVVTAFNK
jgi:hypothetical protein